MLLQSIKCGIIYYKLSRLEVSLEEINNQVNNLKVSNETHFLLSGFLNNQNFRYWFDANTRYIMNYVFILKKLQYVMRFQQIYPSIFFFI